MLQILLLKGNAFAMNTFYYVGTYVCGYNLTQSPYVPRSGCLSFTPTGTSLVLAGFLPLPLLLLILFVFCGAFASKKKNGCCVENINHIRWALAVCVYKTSSLFLLLFMLFHRRMFEDDMLEEVGFSPLYLCRNNGQVSK